jgi:hypothetical protein
MLIVFLGSLLISTAFTFFSTNKDILPISPFIRLTVGIIAGKANLLSISRGAAIMLLILYVYYF